MSGGPHGRLMALLAWLLLAVAPAAAEAPAAPSANPKVFALFVGINSYPQVQANFTPAPVLKGPVNDVALIRNVLATKHGLEVGPMPTAESCETSFKTVITLIESCAKQAAILDRLGKLLGEAADGDLVLFYFAGHGIFRDGRLGGQITNSSLILPYDAEPDPTDARSASGHYIYDVQLRDLLWAAQRKGVSVLTIFDSCSSGTATRDLRPEHAVRAATRVPTGPIPVAQVTEPPPPGDAYLVHLAAVADDGVAAEAEFDDGGKKQVNGVFTRSLVDVLADLPRSASYRDVAQRTGALMAARGAAGLPNLDTKALGMLPKIEQLSETAAARLKAQQAQAEGALGQSFLGRGRVLPPVFEAQPKGALQLQLAGAGRLTGVRTGSVFSVHCLQTEAEAGQNAIGTATVAAVEPAGARLTLAAALSVPCAKEAPLWVRETRHSYAGTMLHLGLLHATPAERQLVNGLLQGDGLLAVGGDLPGYVLTWEEGPDRCKPETGPRTLALRRGEGGEVACLGDAAAPDIGQAIERTLRALANYHAVADLPAGSGDPNLVATISIEGQCDGDECVVYGPREIHKVPAGSTLHVRVRDAKVALYANLLMLDGRNLAVQPVYGAANAIDAPIPREGSRYLFRGRVCAPGPMALLVLLTRERIDVSALRQQPVRDASLGEPNALERLLMLAGQGRRSVTPVVPNWTAQLTRFTIEKEGTCQ